MATNPDGSPDILRGWRHGVREPDRRESPLQFGREGGGASRLHIDVYQQLLSSREERAIARVVHLMK
jgi:hypothetical protein